MSTTSSGIKPRKPWSPEFFSGLTAAIFLMVCLLLVAGYQVFDDSSDGNTRDCQGKLNDPGDSSAAFGITGVWPTKSEIGRHICIGVTGVISKDEEDRGAKKAEDEKGNVAQLEAKLGTLAKDSADFTTTKKNLDAAKTRYDAALAAQSQGKTEPLKLFLNDVPAIGINDDMAKATVNAKRMAGFQVLVIELKTSSDHGAELWGKVLRGTRLAGEGSPWSRLQAPGVKEVFVGLARGDASAPDIVSNTSVELTVYYPLILLLGSVSFLLFALCLVFMARNTTLLRDNDLMEVPLSGDADFRANAVKIAAAVAALDTARKDEVAAKAANDAVAEKTARDNALKEQGNLDVATTAMKNAARETPEGKPKGTYSLARAQLALWILLVLAGFLFTWITIGQYNNLLTPEILVLLGITGMSTIASVQITRVGDEKGSETTKGFYKDILNDSGGPSLYRLQSLAWTLILAVIFVWNIFWNFTFVKFDTNLLLFMGISQSMYLGFKYQAQSPRQ